MACLFIPVLNWGTYLQTSAEKTMLLLLAYTLARYQDQKEMHELPCAEIVFSKLSFKTPK